MPKENYSVDLAAFIYDQIILKYARDVEPRLAACKISHLIQPFSDIMLAISYLGDNIEAEYNKNKDSLDERMSEFICCTDSPKNQAFSVLAHIRNSFAHDRVELSNDGRYFSLFDEWKRKKTMYARFKKTTFKKFINRLQQQIEEQLIVMEEVTRNPIFTELNPDNTVIIINQFPDPKRLSQKRLRETIEMQCNYLKEKEVQRKDAIFIPLLEFVQKYLKDIPFKEKPDDLTKDIEEMKNIMAHIQQRYKLKEKLELNLDLFQKLLSKIFTRVDELQNIEDAKTEEKKSYKK